MPTLIIKLIGLVDPYNCVENSLPLNNIVSGAVLPVAVNKLSPPPPLPSTPLNPLGANATTSVLQTSSPTLGLLSNRLIFATTRPSRKSLAAGASASPTTAAAASASAAAWGTGTLTKSAMGVRVLRLPAALV